MEFSNGSLEYFWSSQLKMHSVLVEKAPNVLVPFATTYLCETGFSRMLPIKSKTKNRLDPQHDKQVALSTMTPRFAANINRKQQQKSH